MAAAFLFVFCTLPLAVLGIAGGDCDPEMQACMGDMEDSIRKASRRSGAKILMEDKSDHKAKSTVVFDDDGTSAAPTARHSKPQKKKPVQKRKQVAADGGKNLARRGHASLQAGMKTVKMSTTVVDDDIDI
eukprot:TRINITY_DN77512_c0_g1_i1.p1 TRINITY_DN77512_c0_g1~~TRINITY_DN77512_c0_g1_i1.p1  ORF type:complete len:131 (-),score=44.98 TRINITY_DN77512_c0_g1_i1:121-513(-)